MVMCICNRLTVNINDNFLKYLGLKLRFLHEKEQPLSDGIESAESVNIVDTWFFLIFDIFKTPCSVSTSVKNFRFSSVTGFRFLRC